MSKVDMAMHEVLTLGLLLTLSFALTVTGYAQEINPSTPLDYFQASQAPVFLQSSGHVYLLGDASTEGEEEWNTEPPWAREIVAGTGYLVAALVWQFQ